MNALTQDYDARRKSELAAELAQKAEYAEKLRAIGEYGTQKKYWVSYIVTSFNHDGEAIFPNMSLVTAPGHRFSVCVERSYGKKPAVLSCGIGAIKKHGITVSPRDVVPCVGPAAPTGGFSPTRPTASLADDIYRRMVNNYEAIQIAEAMRITLARRADAKADLATRIPVAESHGIRFAKGDGEQAESHVRGYAEWGNDVTLYANGVVQVTIGIPLDKVAALRELLGK